MIPVKQYLLQSEMHIRLLALSINSDVELRKALLLIGLIKTARNWLIRSQSSSIGTTLDLAKFGTIHTVFT